MITDLKVMALRYLIVPQNGSTGTRLVKYMPHHIATLCMKPNHNLKLIYFKEVGEMLRKVFHIASDFFFQGK